MSAEQGEVKNNSRKSVNLHPDQIKITENLSDALGISESQLISDMLDLGTAVYLWGLNGRTVSDGETIFSSVLGSFKPDRKVLLNQLRSYLETKRGLK